MNIFSAKRREPRVRLKTRVQIAGRTPENEAFCYETLTLDVSPHGASVLVEAPLPIGTEVTFSAVRYAFHARAVVRSVSLDQETGGCVLGLQYPDHERNPLVIWQAVESEDEARRTDEQQNGSQ
jgi:hypothetical protein